MQTNQSKNTHEPIFHKPKIIRVSKNWLWPVRILLLALATYFINKSYFGYIEKVTYGRRNYEYYLSDDPFMFWLIILGSLLIASLLIWQSFRVKVKS